MRTRWSVPIIFMAYVCLNSCSDSTVSKDADPLKPGDYSISVNLSPEEDGGEGVRGLNAEDGTFNNIYPYDYIYLHKADNKEGDAHESIKIALANSDCIDCDKAIQLEIRVNDDGSYDVRAKGTETPMLSMGANEQVYFSTIPGAYWNAEKLENQQLFVPDEALPTPVQPGLEKTRTILKQTTASSANTEGNDANSSGELLKSQQYNCEQLINLQASPMIPLSRHCTAFRVYIMFSMVSETGAATIIPELWGMLLSGTSYENFYSKVYFGPNFATKYDVLNDAVPADDRGGYYSTMFQDDNGTNEYKQFGPVEYGATSGGVGGGAYTMNGYGYMTELGNYLLSPLNGHISVDDFGFYVFVKYSKDSSVNLTSDEGGTVRWFRVNPIPNMSLDRNRVHWIVLAFDLRDLKTLVDAYNDGETNTMGTTGARSAEDLISIPQLELTPIKVIVE